MKRNNAGVSMVELIIAIAIISAMTGIGIYSVGRVQTYRARECSKTIASSITANKVATLGKAKSTGNICWQLYNDDGDYYICNVYDADATPVKRDIKKVSKTTNGVIVTYIVSGTEYTINDGDNLTFCFNRSTGAICQSTGAHSVMDISEITVYTKSRNSSFKIELVPETGKVVQ